MWGYNCLLPAVETVDWPLALSGSDSETVLLGEYGLCGELDVEPLVVSDEGSESMGCDLWVSAVEYHLEKQGAWVPYLGTSLPVVVVLKWD